MYLCPLMILRNAEPEASQNIQHFQNYSGSAVSAGQNKVTFLPVASCLNLEEMEDLQGNLMIN